MVVLCISTEIHTRMFGTGEGQADVTGGYHSHYGTESVRVVMKSESCTP